MKLRDFAGHVVIDARKLTEYALNLNNERGQHKARVFARVLGYNQQNYVDLAEHIQAQALDGEAEVMRVDQFGQHVRVDLAVKGTQGQVAIVRTGWVIAPDSDVAALVTVFVKESQND
jgi:hypothetical protein